MNKLVTIKDKKYLVKLWDTVGDDKYNKDFNNNYFHVAHGFVIVFSLNNRKSFDNITTWLKKVHETSLKDLQYVIIANKSDLEEERQISKDEIEEKNLRLGIKIFESSALKKINVEESIQYLIQQIHQSVYATDEGANNSTAKGISIEDKDKSKSQSLSACLK